MREGWDTCRTLHGLSRAPQRLLPRGARVCVWAGEREYVCVCLWLREGILPLLLSDCASLTGWRGRWGHCNKANTHIHTHFSMVVMSSLLLLFPASTLPSFQDLFSTSFPRRLALIPLASCFPQSVCKALTLSLYLSSPTPPYSLPLSLPLWLYGNINMLPLIWRGEGHMLFLAGGPQPAKLLGCVYVCVCVRPVGL